MTTWIHRACAEHGSCEISSASLQPRDVLPKLLDALKELAPAVHQQITMPGAGFALIPSDALDDGESHPFWETEAAAEAMVAMMDALDEHAPEGFTFGSHEGDGASYGFWPVGDDEETDPNEPIAPPSRDVIDHMMFWHGGQGSSLYAAASCWLAGRTVPRETAEAARDELERFSSQPHFGDGDAAALAALNAHLGEEPSS